MITYQRYARVTLLFLALAIFTFACGDSESEETVNTSDNVMFSTPDVEDTNYDGEVTVEQATPFSEETAVASEASAANSDFGTQPRRANPERELEYFNNAYQKAFSTSTTHQRAVVPGYQKNRPAGDYDDNTPVGYPNTPAPEATKKGLFDGQKPPANQQEATPASSSVKSAEWSRSNNPTDYVKPDSTQIQ